MLPINQTTLAIEVLFVSSVILTNTVFTPFIGTAFAAVPDKKCDKAIVSAKERILKVKNLDLLRVEKTDLTQSEDLEKPFPSRSQRVYFLLGKAGGANFMSSPKLMQSMSSELINRCQSVASVSFVFSGTDWGEEYGIFQDGTIRAFKCVAPQGENQKLVWGTHICL